MLPPCFCASLSPVSPLDNLRRRAILRRGREGAIAHGLRHPDRRRRVERSGPRPRAGAGGYRASSSTRAPAGSAPTPASTAAPTSLSLGSRRMLAALGLWPEGRARGAAPLRHHHQRRSRRRGASPLWLHFDSDEIDEGPMGHILEDRYLRAALQAALAADPLVEVRDGAAVTGQSVTPAAAFVHPRQRHAAFRRAPRRLRRPATAGWPSGPASAAGAATTARARSSAPSTTRSPTAAWRIGLTSCPKDACHSAAPRQPLVHRLDRDARPRRGHRAPRPRRLARRAPPPLRRLPRRDFPLRRALLLPARPLAGRTAHRRALPSSATPRTGSTPSPGRG